jgi:hypothetical protein
MEGSQLQRVLQAPSSTCVEHTCNGLELVLVHHQPARGSMGASLGCVYLQAQQSSCKKWVWGAFGRHMYMSGSYCLAMACITAVAV